MPGGPMEPAAVRDIVADALAEDRADLDVTAMSLADWMGRATGEIVARAAGVVCGIDFARAAFEITAPGAAFAADAGDGEAVAAGRRIARIEGPAAGILAGERVALNFLQRLSGTATLTAAAVAAAGRGGRARILDTRKTTPGLRAAERYAVRCGGGLNHRDNLAAGVLIKDNHVAAVRAAGGSLGDAVRAALQNVGPATAVEVEVASVAEAGEALAAGARALLLDNFAPADLPAAADLASDAGATAEASGGIALADVEAISAAGVDFISLGALTHSAPALDIALDLRF